MRHNMPQATQDISAKYGKWMMRLTWVIGLALASYFFQHWIDDKRNPNKNIHFTTEQKVILKQNTRGHYVAPGTINNIPVTFLLDTGATDVVVPQALAEKLGLSHASSTQVSTANGIITVYNTILSEVSLAGLKGSKIDAVINPYMDESTVLLGMSFLRGLSIVQQSGYLTLSAINEK